MSVRTEVLLRGSRRTSVWLLLLPSLLLSGTGDTVAAAAGEGGSSLVPPGPRISWTRARDATGALLFAGSEARPLNIAPAASGTILLVEAGDDDRILWWSEDGGTWEAVSDGAGVFDGGTGVVDGVVGFRKGFVAFGTDVQDRTRLWHSKDGRSWSSVPLSSLAPFRNAGVTDIVPVRDLLMAYGEKVVRGAKEAGLWSSRNGIDWKERPEFAATYPGAVIEMAAEMGQNVVSFGRSGGGRPSAWVVPLGSTRELARQERGAIDHGSGLPAELHVAREAGLAVGPRRGLEGRVLWRSVNSWDWEQVVPGASAASESGVLDAASAFVSDGHLIYADSVSSDGSHSFLASVDAQSWDIVESEGDVPDSTDLPLLAMSQGRILVAGEGGVWVGSVDADGLGSTATVAETPTGPVGADPPLRPPVKRLGRGKRALDTAAKPSASASRAGVSLEMWLPKSRVRSRDGIPLHVRITNGSDRTIYATCPAGSTRAHIGALFGPGKSWSGNAAVFKKRLLREALAYLPFASRRGDGARCLGDVGLTISIGPGERHDYDAWLRPRYLVRDQPLPSGDLPVQTKLRFGFSRGRDSSHALNIESDVRIGGTDWPWATPQQLADAMLEDPRFKAYIDRLDPPRWWSNTTFHVEGPGGARWIVPDIDSAPDGAVIIGLFGQSWIADRSDFTEMRLDPWTGTVLGYSER